MPEREETLEEIARRFEVLIDDDSQDHTFVPVNARVNVQGSVFAARFTKEGLRLSIRQP